MVGKALVWAGAGAGVILALAASGPARAACQCACVEGRTQAICEYANELPPLCAFQICPLTPFSTAPISREPVPPSGAQFCSPQMVYNQAASRYEWQSLCR